MKNKFALCFRPVGIETEESDHKLHVNTTDLHQQDVAVSTTTSPKFSCQPRWKNGSKRPLSPLLKSLLFGTSSSGFRVADDKPVKKNKKEAINIRQVSSSNSFSSTSSSSSSSSFGSVSDPSSEEPIFDQDHDSKLMKKRDLERTISNSFYQKKKPKTITILLKDDNTFTSKQDYYLIIYFIILALFATVVWGKYLAVLFTSLCLYIIPTASNNWWWLPENAVKSPEEMDTSKEKKKRVIMEGLLQRKLPIQTGIKFMK